MITTEEWSIDASGTLVLHNGSVIERLNLNGRTDLVALPDEMHVEGDLVLSGCTSLVRMPRKLTVDEDLYMVGCTSLENIDGSLHVFGNIALDGCAALRSLPDDLVVMHGFYATRCPALSRLPSPYRLGDVVETDHFRWEDNSKLVLNIKLPESVVIGLRGRAVRDVIEHPWLEQFGVSALRIMGAHIDDFTEQISLRLEQKNIAYHASRFPAGEMPLIMEPVHG